MRHGGLVGGAGGRLKDASTQRPGPAVRGNADGPFPRGAFFGYIFLALLVIVPATLHCGLRGWRHGRLLLLAAVSFALAFVCREADAAAVSRLLPMGSHFVWHLGGASASFFAISYLMASEEDAAGRAMESERV